MRGIRDRRFVTATLAVTLAVGLGACRQLREAKKDDKEKDDEKAPVLVGKLPTRVGSAGGGGSLDAKAPPVATSVDVDAKSGLLKADLVLRLDYFPAARPGQTSLPVCYDPFPETFDLGTVSCDDGSMAPRPLLARNVVQECYTKAAAAQGQPSRIEAKEALQLPGCRRVTATLHRFDPAMRIDAEVRD